MENERTSEQTNELVTDEIACRVNNNKPDKRRRDPPSAYGFPVQSRWVFPLWLWVRFRHTGPELAHSGALESPRAGIP